MIDTLRFVTAASDAGADPELAKAFANAFVEASRDEVTTKADLLVARGESRADLAGLRGELKTEIGAVRSELKADMAAVRNELKADLAAVRGELKADIAALGSKLDATERTTLARMNALSWRHTAITLGIVLGHLAAVWTLLADRAP